MKIDTKQEILDVLALPAEAFWSSVAPEARRACEAARGKKLTVTTMLGFSNLCKNACLYCGMRAANKIPRYRLAPDEVIRTGVWAAHNGFTRIFLLSGEDPKYGFENLLEIVSALHGAGLFITLACGEYAPGQYGELRAAGADEYVVKFEMSHADSFNRLNPSTTFEKRMTAIEAVKHSGLRLGSGNIIGWPGQSADELADDILLTKALEVSWAPVIPYLPAQNTPLAAEGGPGDLLTALKEIAVLRLMMPAINITAQQPGKNPAAGLADLDGNADAVTAGGNIVFCDLLPDAKAQAFRVIDNRCVTGTEHLRLLSERTGLALDL